MQLQRTTHTALDISAEIEVLTYTHSDEASRVAVARVDLGSLAGPIAGSGNYAIKLYLNDHPVSPVSSVTVPASVTQTTIQSRQILIEDGDVVSLRVTGLPADTAVDTVGILFDVTPASTGGSIPVDHDYGGEDSLAYKTEAGAGIDGATIRSYLTSDYVAGRRTGRYMTGESTTNSLGQWRKPMMLSPGDYTLLFFRTGFYGPNTRTVTVDEEN